MCGEICPKMEIKRSALIVRLGESTIDNKLIFLKHNSNICKLLTKNEPSKRSS